MMRLQLPALLLALLPFSIPAQQWVLQNPLPTPNTLFALTTVDANTVYAVGTMGTVIKTTDGGQSWQTLKTGTRNSLISISVVNANVLYAVGNRGTILKTADGGTNWMVQSSGTTKELKCVVAVNAQVAYAVGDTATVLKTEDGGATWAPKAPPFGYYSFFSVSAVNVDTVFVGGNGNSFKTVDGGNNWTRLDRNLPSFPSIAAIDGNTAVAIAEILSASDTFFVYRTADGGATWIGDTAKISRPLLLSNSGVLYGNGIDGILKSTDAGASWQLLAPTPFDSVFSFAAVEPNTFYALQYWDPGNELQAQLEAPQMHKTMDAGRSWTSIVTGGDVFALSTVAIANENTAYAGGFGKLCKTTNGGATWAMRDFNTPGALNSISAPSSEILYAVGGTVTLDTSYGFILKSTDGGGNWVQQISGQIPYLKSVSAANSNVVYAVGVSGSVLKTTDGGITWNPSTTGTLRTLNSVSALGENLAIAVGELGTILKTTDGGNSWKFQEITRAILSSVSIADSNSMFVVGSQGTILASDDGGTIWLQIRNVTQEWLSSVAAANSKVAYAVGSRDFGPTLIRTQDGGLTWQHLDVAYDKDMLSIAVANSGTAYIVGYGGLILRNNNVLAAVRPGLRSPFAIDFDRPGRLRFSLPSRQRVSARILDMQGRVLAVFPLGSWEKGEHTWRLPMAPAAPGVLDFRAGNARRVMVLPAAR